MGACGSFLTTYDQGPDIDGGTAWAFSLTDFFFIPLTMNMRFPRVRLPSRALEMVLSKRINACCVVDELFYPLSDRYSL